MCNITKFIIHLYYSSTDVNETERTWKFEKRKETNDDIDLMLYSKNTIGLSDVPKIYHIPKNDALRQRYLPKNVNLILNTENSSYTISWDHPPTDYDQNIIKYTVVWCKLYDGYMCDVSFFLTS